MHPGPNSAFDTPLMKLYQSTVKTNQQPYSDT